MRPVKRLWEKKTRFFEIFITSMCGAMFFRVQPLARLYDERQWILLIKDKVFDNLITSGAWKFADLGQIKLKLQQNSSKMTEVATNNCNLSPIQSSTGSEICWELVLIASFFLHFISISLILNTLSESTFFIFQGVFRIKLMHMKYKFKKQYAITTNLQQISLPVENCIGLKL